jgi:hypothetical protein
MSSVGRIFIVLNLILAGVFVYFSGVVLREQADWKAKHTVDVAAKNKEIDALKSNVVALGNDVSAKERQLDTAAQVNETIRSELKKEQERNEAAEKRLAAVQGDLATLQANTTTTAAAIERASKSAEEQSKLALEASRVRDESIRAKEVAVADLRDANDKIAALEATIGGNGEMIAKLETQVREQGVLIEFANSKMPGLFAHALPKLGGTIQRVDADGQLLTVLVTDDPSEVGVKPGYTFAVFNGQKYKGEALVTDVDGKFAFCRVTRSTGEKIVTGDSASTQTN